MGQSVECMGNRPGCFSVREKENEKPGGACCCSTREKEMPVACGTGGTGDSGSLSGALTGWTPRTREKICQVDAQIMKSADALTESKQRVRALEEENAQL